MPVKIVCLCGRNLIVPDERAGKTVECPKCGHKLRVPGEPRAETTARDAIAPSPSLTISPAAIIPPIPPPIPPPAPPAPPRIAPPPSWESIEDLFDRPRREKRRRPRAPSIEAPPPLVTEPPLELPTPDSAALEPPAPVAAFILAPQPPARVEEPPIPPPVPLPETPSSEEIPAPAPMDPLPPLESLTVEAESPSAGAAPPEPILAPMPVAPLLNPPLPTPPRPPQVPLRLIVEKAGYQPDAEKLAAAYVLSTLVTLLGVFSMIPGALEVARYLSDVEDYAIGRFAFVMFLLGSLHLAYALYLVQMPDWSSSWTLTAATLLEAALYAAILTTIVLSQGQSQIIQSLDLAHHVANGRAAAWCFVMFCLSGVVAYFCGRMSIRWRRAFLTVRNAHGG